jgi:hypothetical protein
MKAALSVKDIHSGRVKVDSLLSRKSGGTP